MFTTSSNTGISIIIITAVLLLLTTFIVSILFLYQKRQFVYYSELEKLKNEHRNNLLSTQLEIQENTIQSISRDIHDNINLNLTLAKLNLNTIYTNNLPNESEKIQDTIELVSTAINDLANLSRSMNADLLKEQGLIHALSNETEKIKKLDRFEIDIEINGEPLFMDFQKELFIFRIIQESLNNILKHSNANKIRLCLEYNEKELKVLVLDNGVGIESSNVIGKRSSTGILNMQKRAALIGGRLEINSQPGKGAIVTLNVPY